MKTSRLEGKAVPGTGGGSHGWGGKALEFAREGAKVMVAGRNTRRVEDAVGTIRVRPRNQASGRRFPEYPKGAVITEVEQNHAPEKARNEG